MLFSFQSYAQEIPGDTLKEGLFDTTQIEIQSRKYFQFCSKVYEVPRICEGSYPPDCCSYQTYLQKSEKVAISGSVSCDNGSSFQWTYTPTLEVAKLNYDIIPPQIEKQVKSFKKLNVKCIVFGKETDGVITESVSPTHYKTYMLMTYSTHMGYNFLLQYRSLKPITGTESIQPVFREFLKIK